MLVLLLPLPLSFSGPMAMRPARPALASQARPLWAERASEIRASAPGMSGLVVPTGAKPKQSVPLSGDTLTAALKMRCDTSDASYAIYWANQNGKFVVAGSFKSAKYEQELKSRGVTESFADASKARSPLGRQGRGTG